MQPDHRRSLQASRRCQGSTQRGHVGFLEYWRLEIRQRVHHDGYPVVVENLCAAIMAPPVFPVVTTASACPSLTKLVAVKIEAFGRDIAAVFGSVVMVRTSDVWQIDRECRLRSCAETDCLISRSSPTRMISMSRVRTRSRAALTRVGDPCRRPLCQ